MNKKSAVAWIVMFGLFIIVAPLVLMFRNSNDIKEQEYRTMTTIEDIKDATPSSFLSTVVEAYEDNCPGKDLAVEIKNTIDMDLLNVTPNEDVIIGKDGWLYMTSYVDWNTGAQILDDSEIDIIAQKIKQIEKELSSNGTRVVVMIVPNKATIYPEYLPDTIEKNEQCNAEKIMEAFAEQKIETYWYTDELREYKDTYQLYFQRDTHWTSIGAYISTRLLVQELGSDLPPIEELEIYPKDYEDENLARQIGIAGVLEPEKDYDYFGYGMGRGLAALTGWDPDGDGKIFHTENATEKNVYVLRDSFFTFMMPFFTQSFSDVFVRHIDKYQAGEIYDKNPDIVVIELCEARFWQLRDLAF